MFGHATYLVLELGWALPVILLQIALGWRELWAQRTAWFGATAASTVYLCLADRLAIGDGIWHIAPNRSTGILIGGLPLEEAVFFLLTNLLVVQAMLLFMAPSMRARAASWLRLNLNIEIEHEADDFLAHRSHHLLEHNVTLALILNQRIALRHRTKTDTFL
ncbi:MAG: lycopene cyclase domain-containing protein [Proteobacteria bacterium]|nr:lycopene cyclase domain-containing protein [Pseudomonadota bacterium]